MTKISGPVTPAGRRADRFSRLVDGEDQLRGESDVALLAVVDSLREPMPDIPRPRPSSDFSRDLRERLMAEADEVLVPTDARLVLPDRGGRSRRRATAVAAAFVLVGSSAGMAVAARGTVEGDPLYAVKRGLEAVDASVSLSQTDRGEDYLSQSRTRLTEVSTLLGSSDDLSPVREQAVRNTLERFARSASKGSDLLFTAYQRDTSGEDVAAVRSFAATSMPELSRLAADAPEQLQDQISQAATMLTDLDQQARVLCAACGAREPLELPDVLLPASSGYALEELIDGGTTEAADGARADTPLPRASAPATPRSGAAGGKARGSRQVPSTGAAAPAVPRSGSATPSTGSAAQATDPVTRAVKKAPRLVKLPGSQSGAPSVIDLDKTVKDLTGGLTSTTQGLLGTRQGG